MQKTEIENIINEIKEELKQKYSDFRGLYLFGSRARGDFNENSDYDIALIFDREIDWRFENEISNSICLLMIKYDVIIDQHLFNLNDILYPKTPLRENIFYEGVFYDR